MTTRYISAVFLTVATTLAIAAASAESPPAQSPPAQGQAGASAQASGQGAVGVDPSGAKAQDNASSSAAAHAGDNSAALAGDSSVNAVLTKPVDSRRGRPRRRGRRRRFAGGGGWRRPAGGSGRGGWSGRLGAPDRRQRRCLRVARPESLERCLGCGSGIGGDVDGQERSP